MFSKRAWIGYLPEAVEKATRRFVEETSGLRELRMRVNSPLTALTTQRGFIRADGRATSLPDRAYYVTESDCRIFFRNITGSSVYALEQQLAGLYITVEGGVRVGLSGSGVVENGKIKLIRDCMSFNIRIPHEVRNCAAKVMPYIFDNGVLQSTLIISPPGAGKTTLLRDIAYQLSGAGAEGTYNVSIADERSEIAACVSGVPQFDVGISTDVLDNCPKAQGIQRLIRVMAPDVVITDEIGTPADAQAIMEAVNSGVTVIASAHGANTEEALRRNGLQELIGAGVFGRYIVLSSVCGPGTVEGIYDRDLHLLKERKRA